MEERVYHLLEIAAILLMGLGQLVRFGRLEQKVLTMWNWFEGRIIGKDLK